jgi:PBP1b-binding outer membrane lipoprotein LpoB
MLKKKYTVILGIMLLALIVSGCTDRDTQADDDSSENAEGATLSEADAALMDEMIGVTDPEIMQLETEMAEFEALVSEMNAEESISVEEI